MNSSQVSIPMESGWDHVDDITKLIRNARYAIIGALPSQAPTVRLVNGNTSGTVKYTAIQLTKGDGLHYDADGTMTQAHLKREVESGRYRITQSWRDCEQYLTDPPA